MTFLLVQQPSRPVDNATASGDAGIILAMVVVAAIVISVWLLMGEWNRGRASDGRRLVDEAERWLRNRRSE